MDTTAALFSEQAFMPHGHCYLWTPGLVWLQVISNLSIGISYVAISLILGLLVARVRSLPFRWVYVAFGVFIITCGLTHFMDVWVIWQPRYWLDGFARAITAIASVATALTLPRLLPQVGALVRHAELAHERGLALEASVADLESTYRKAKELDEARTTFFSNVSHELRTPLTLIVGPLDDLLRDATLSAAQREALELIARNGRLLLTHVNDLLDLAKLEVTRVEPTWHNADLALLLRSVGDYFAPLAQKRRVQIAFATPAELVVSVDPEKVQRILINLLSNAFKFTPSGGRIQCSLTARGRPEESAGEILLTVGDSGPGVPLEQRQALFERFHQGLQPASGSLGSSGLGLALVRELTELHGGRVWVSDSELGGALFNVAIPWRQGNKAALAAPPPEALIRGALAELTVTSPDREASRDELTARERPVILFVEDNADMRKFVGRALESHYTLAFACDGEEGLTQACALRPDLILSDLMMPKLNGEQLVMAIRSVRELSHIPIMLLTAKADAELRERLLQDGAQDYVLKPFSSDELRARVANLVTLKRTRDLLQKALSESERDVERLSRLLLARNEELMVALDDARRANRLKSDFLSLVSHELRTPLSSIRLQLDLLRLPDPNAEDFQSAVTRIARASARLLDLVDSLLEFGRIESGRLEIRSSEVDLRRQVAEVLDELRPRAEQKGLTLAADIAEDVLPIASDARLCRLILVNLIENAIKYTELGSITVVVRARPPAGVAIEVRDTGPGIELELQSRVFEPFEQGEQVRNKHMPGVGLGLSLARGIARSLGGDVSLVSQPGHGSAFHVTLASV